MSLLKITVGCCGETELDTVIKLVCSSDPPATVQGCTLLNCTTKEGDLEYESRQPPLLEASNKAAWRVKQTYPEKFHHNLKSCCNPLVILLGIGSAFIL